MFKRYAGILFLLLFIGALLAACAPKMEEEPEAGLANPASVYCEEQGGDLEIRETEAGQYGVCLFDDGSECEEWAYFRGECKPGDLEVAPAPEA